MKLAFKWWPIVGLIVAGCSGSPPLSAGEINSVSEIEQDSASDTSIQAAPTSTALPTPTSSSSPTPSATPQNSPTPAATPSPTPTPGPSLQQLTTGGCCVQPYFSPDGQQALFIDKPGPEAPVGIYGVDIDTSQATPDLIYETIGFRNPDGTIVATIEGDLARFTNESTGESWTVNTNGNRPHYSPDGSQILWVASDREGPYDRRKSEIWLAGLDGSNPRLLITLTGGGFVGWLADGQRIALINRDNPGEEEQTLLLFDIARQQRTDLVTEKRIRDVEISPGGSWLAYYLTFSDEPEKDGIWTISSDGEQQSKLNVPGFGAYQWRDDSTLFYIPMRSSPDESMQLWAVDVSANQSSPLTNPNRLTFSISNGDWRVSPNGEHVIFVNSRDQNIWLLTIPR